MNSPIQVVRNLSNFWPLKSFFYKLYIQDSLEIVSISNLKTLFALSDFGGHKLHWGGHRLNFWPHLSDFLKPLLQVPVNTVDEFNFDPT